MQAEAHRTGKNNRQTEPNRNYDFSKITQAKRIETDRLLPASSAGCMQPFFVQVLVNTNINSNSNSNNNDNSNTYDSNNSSDSKTTTNNNDNNKSNNKHLNNNIINNDNNNDMIVLF